MTQLISRAEFERMLSDPEVPDNALRPYVMLDPLESSSLQPCIIANPATVASNSLESAMALSSLNGIARWRRNQRYHNRIVKGWTGPKVVAEGDSWLQYPLLLDDVIDHLSDQWAIYCVSAAGDLLRDMARQDEIGVAVRAERPDFLLLSGGGNDILGGGSLERHLLRYKPGNKADDHINDSFNAMLKASLEIYADIIEIGLTAGAKMVVCHCYDYTIPNSGKWLGRPLAKLGIVEPALQQDILRVLIDRFHDGLVRMAVPFGGRVRIADTRNTVNPGNWYDELHPTSRGYRGPAEKIRKTACPTGLETSVQVPGPDDRPINVADTLAVKALLSTSDEILMDELGRRKIIIELDPLAASGMSLSLTHSGLESMGQSLRKTGARVLAQYHKKLFELVCTNDDKNSKNRDSVRNSLSMSESSLTGVITTALTSLACPPFLSPLIAALIVRRGIYPIYQETCRAWGESLTAKDTEI